MTVERTFALSSCMNGFSVKEEWIFSSLTTSIASSSFVFLDLAFAFAVMERMAVDTCKMQKRNHNHKKSAKKKPL